MTLGMLLETFRKRDLPMSLFYPPIIRNHVERLYTGIIHADGIISRTTSLRRLSRPVTSSPKYKSVGEIHYDA